MALQGALVIRIPQWVLAAWNEATYSHTRAIEGWVVLVSCVVVDRWFTALAYSKNKGIAGGLKAPACGSNATAGSGAEGNPVRFWRTTA